MANWAKRFRCSQVVLAPDEEDALRGRPNLGRRIPIARLATTKGWTVFETPSTLGVQFRAGAARFNAAARRSARQSTQAVP